MNFSSDLFKEVTVSSDAMEAIRKEAKEREERRIAEAFISDEAECRKIALMLAKQRKEINKKIAKLKKAKNPKEFAKIASNYGYYAHIQGSY